MIIKEYILFSDEQKHQANTVDLEDYLLRRGEKLLPSGRDKRLATNHSVTRRSCPLSRTVCTGLPVDAGSPPA